MTIVSATARWSVAEVYEDMHRRILTGQLRPGTALSEMQIAGHYSLSRTPIRQVFQRLADAGFLSVVPQVGTYVAPIQMAAIRDAQFLRETLECRTVRQAAEAPIAGKKRILKGILKDQAQTLGKRDSLAFFACDEALHHTLMEMAGHPHIWDLIVSAKAQLDRLRYLSLESPDWLEMMFAQHEEIVDRVIASDSDGAAHVMEAHLRTTFAAIDRIAAEHARFFEDEQRPRPLRPSAARRR
jgi:DNA-binding GntR family transcriptional regulator